MHCIYCASCEMVEREYEIHLLKYHEDKLDSDSESFCSLIDTIDNERPPSYESLVSNDTDSKKNIKTIIIAKEA